MMIVTEVENLMQRISDDHTGRVLDARRSRGQVTSCAVCTLHVESRSVSFLVEPQNQGRWFVNDFASKSLGRFFPV
jgi:hypothetical protein